jgi:chromosome segregation ATPase
MGVLLTVLSALGGGTLVKAVDAVLAHRRAAHGQDLDAVERHIKRLEGEVFELSAARTAAEERARGAELDVARLAEQHRHTMREVGEAKSDCAQCEEDKRRLREYSDDLKRQLHEARARLREHGILDTPPGDTGRHRALVPPTAPDPKRGPK